MQSENLFLTEISVMKKLSHPYIIRYLGAGLLTDPASGKASVAVVRSRCLLLV